MRRRPVVGVTGEGPTPSFEDADPTPGYERGSVPVGLAIETHSGKVWVCASRGECARHSGRQLLDAEGVCVHCRAREHRPSGS